MTRKNREHISTEKFVQNWISASSVEEVAQKLNVDVQYVLRRGHKLRNGGIKINELSCNYAPVRSGRKTLDYTAINRIVSDFNSGIRIDSTAPSPSSGSVADSLNQAISYGTK